MSARTQAPPAPLPGFLREILQTASRRLLKLDPDAARALGELEGRVFRVRLINPDIEFYVVPTAAGLSFESEVDTEVSTTLRGSPFALFSLSMSGSEAGLPAGHVEISGDVESGRRLAEILKHLDPDWEEPLAMLVGDVAAHEMGRALRGGLAWARDASRRMAENTARFFTEESGDIVSGSQIAEFCAEVDRLRDDVERLQARVRQHRDPE